MKSLSTFLLLLALPMLGLAQGTQIELLSEDEEATIFSVQIMDWDYVNVQTPNGEQKIVTLADGTPLLEAGSPDLPKLTTSLIIPTDAKMNVEVIGQGYMEVNDLDIAPSKGNLYRNIDPATVPYTYGAVYNTDAFFPANQVSLRESYQFRDFTGQTVIINPFQYNPVSKTLRIYTELVVKLSPQDNSVVNNSGHTPASGRIVKPYEVLYQKRFLNYGAGPEYDQVGELGNMLIVSHADYIDQMEPLITWKRQKGIPVEIVDIDSIATTSDELKDFVQDYYDTKGLTYLLLVGDEYAIPTIMVNYGGEYSCDNCFGYVAGDDHYPDLMVGRFNAEDSDQVATMLNRNMAYEINPNMDNDWFSTAFGLASQEGAGIGDDGEADYEHNNNIKIDLLDYTYSDVYEFYDGSHGSESPTPTHFTADAEGNANAAMISTVLNDEGASLMNYTGHGWEQGVSSGSFDVTAVNGLTNAGSYPFFIVVACCTGDFTDNNGGDCLGEAWIRASDDTSGEPTGGIGGLFASIYQSWAPPMEGQDEMMKLVVEDGTYSIRHTLGGIAVHGFGSMNDAYGNGGVEMTDTWNMFGDPSVVLWTATPETMTVSHPSAVPFGTSELVVDANVEGAMVSVFQDDRILGTGFIDGGTTTIIFDDPINSTENLVVTATAHNYLPYQGDVFILVSGPYVLLQEVIVDDVAGNDNQLWDFNENVDLDVNLENIGLDDANDVNLQLSTTHPLVDLTANNTSVGAILSGQTILQDNSYSGVLTGAVDDQEEVILDILITDDQANEFTDQVSVLIQAPKLSIPTYILDDNAGGNGNGRLENGETATIIVTNLNDGHSAYPDAEANIISSDAFITIQNATASVGTIDQGGDSQNAIFQITVAPDAPISTKANFDYTLEAGYYSVSTTLEFDVNLIVDDFESNSFTVFDWTNDSDIAPWFITDEVVFEGAYAAQSGMITNNQATALTLEVNLLDDGEITFHRKVSSELDYDKLIFYIDGNQVDEWSGELDWEKQAYPVNSGQHTFVWTYEKDYIFTQGTDAAWVDFVTLPEYESTVTSFSNPTLAAWGASLSPNPAHDFLQVSLSLDQSRSMQFEIFNTVGQRVYLSELQDLSKGQQTFSIPVNQLSSGMYMLQLSADNKQATMKFIVE